MDIATDDVTLARGLFLLFFFITSYISCRALLGMSSVPLGGHYVAKATISHVHRKMSNVVHLKI